MELRDLKTFVAVASVLNFNQAANALHTAQSTVSMRVKALEEELGVRLFDRLGRRVVLTGAGERLLVYGRKLVDLEEEARSWVGADGKSRGTLSVRIPESLCTMRLPEAIRRFRQMYPGVRLRLLPCALHGLAEDLRRGVTDMAFILATEVVQQDMEVECLGVEELALVASPDHPLARRDSLMPTDFAEQPLILSTADCSYRRIFESILSEAGVAPLVVLESGSTSAVACFATQGLGVTILPRIAARELLAAGRLVELPWGEPPLEAAVLMLWHKGKWFSPALTAFMNLCRESLLKTTE